MQIGVQTLNVEHVVWNEEKKPAFEWLQGPLFMQVNDLDMQKNQR